MAKVLVILLNNLIFFCKTSESLVPTIALILELLFCNRFKLSSKEYCLLDTDILNSDIVSSNNLTQEDLDDDLYSFNKFSSPSESWYGLNNLIFFKNVLNL